jgi:TonB family protein
MPAPGAVPAWRVPGREAGTVIRRRTFVLAFVASLLVHLGGVLSTWNVDLFGAPAAGEWDRDRDELEVYLEPVPTPPADTARQEAREPEMPTQIAILPERLATIDPPDRPDYLSIFHSQAADETPGGEATAQPEALLDSRGASVDIYKEELGGAEETFFFTEEDATPQPPAMREEEAAGDDAGQVGDLALGDGAEEPPDSAEEAADGGDEEESLPDLFPTTPPSILKPTPEPAGDRGFEFDDIASGDIQGNVLRSGSYSLNTYAWNWAPWIKRFSDDVARNWIPPYAYWQLGILSGWTTLEMEIAANGTVIRLEVVGREGHASLHQASLAAIRAAAPFAPLPPDFPEEYLAIRYTLEYPSLEELRRAYQARNAARPQGRRR